MRIVIVDDHPLVLAGLTAVLSTEETMEIIGQASTAPAAIELIVNTQPDLALIDLKLGAESGLNVVLNCKKQEVHCDFVILTSTADRATFQQALAAGVTGYALKEAPPEELLYALQLVHKGRKYYDPIFFDTPTVTTNVHQESERLTAKERQVLLALGRGLSNRQIAHELYISEFTVKKHVSQILAKLELNDRTQAALYAQANGLSTFESSRGPE